MRHQGEKRPFYRRAGFWRKTVIVVGVLFVAYLLIGFFLAPWILRGQLEKQLGEKTGREVTIEEVRMNPLTLSATIDGFRMRGANEASGLAETEDFVRFESMHVDVSSSSIWHLAPVLDQIRLQAPQIWVARRADGSLSFEDVLQRLQEEEDDEDEETGLPRFFIHQLDLVDGGVYVRDEAVAPVFEVATTPINFSLREFGLLGEQGSIASLQAESANGAVIAWSGSVDLEPFRSQGQFTISGLNMGAFEAYMAPFYSVSITGSELNVSLPYTVNLEAEELLSVSDASVRLRNLRAALPDAEVDFFKLETLDLTGIELGLTAMQASVASVSFDNGRLIVERLEDGQLALLAPLGASQTGAASEPTEGATPVHYSVESITGSGFAIRYIDRSFEEPLVYGFDLGELAIGQVSDDLSARTPIQISGSFGGKGAVEVEGEVALQPLEGELQLALEGMPLQPLSIVATSMTEISAVAGSIGAEGKIVVQGQDENGLPLVRYQGAFSVSDLVLSAPPESEPVLGLGQLQFNSMQATSAPLQLHAQELVIVAPQAVVQRFEDGNINLLQLVSTPAGEAAAEEALADAPPPAQESVGELPIDLVIDVIRISEGDIYFTDQSTESPVSQHISDLGATVSNFSLSGGQRVDAEIQATVGEGAPFQARASWLAGQYFEQTELTADLHALRLPPLSPYAAQFIGRSPLQGEVLLELSYQVDQAQLNGDQSVRVANLSIGPRLQNTDAPNLPVDLAVSLLKDRNGVIALNVPISGDVANPQFSLAEVISTAFSGLITKAVTAPFSMIGSLFGGGGGESQDGQELSFVVFEPGAASLPSSESSKIDTLARALFERPQLSLSLIATPVSDADQRVLRLEALRQQLTTAAVPGQPTADLSTPTQYRQAVEQAYMAQHGAASADPANAQPDQPAVQEPAPPTPTIQEPGSTTRAFIPGGPPNRRGSRARLFSRPSETVEASAAPAAPEPSAIAAIPAPGTETDPAAEAAPLPSFEEMEQALLAQVQVSDVAINDLRQAREQATIQALLQSQQLEPTRITRAQTTPDHEAPTGAVSFEILPAR